MCGIFGYIGRREDTLPLLLEGLKRLEYRGYDSAGVALITGGELWVGKAVGKIRDLQARIDKTIHFIEHLDATKLDGSETRAIHLKVGGKELHFVGSQYLMGWAWPNFHFHMTTAYCILRHNGVPLGKADFLGEV